MGAGVGEQYVGTHAAEALGWNQVPLPKLAQRLTSTLSLLF